MLWKARDLTKFSVRGEDGELGDVAGLWFDEKSWTVRYLAVVAGSWLEGREVLISPIALDTPNGPARVLPARLDRARVRSAPPIDPGGSAAGSVGRLRRASDVEGLRYEASGDGLGRVEDAVVSDGSWAIRYLEIDTRNLWPGGRKLLVPRPAVRAVDWTSRRIASGLSRALVESSPDYDESAPLSEAFERVLELHYGAEGRESHDAPEASSGAVGASAGEAT